MFEISENKNKLIIFVSHNMDLIKMFCNKCILLKDGKLDFYGETQAAIDKYNDLEI